LRKKEKAKKDYNFERGKGEALKTKLTQKAEKKIHFGKK